MGSARERRTECRCRHCRFLRVALALSDLINCPRSRGGFPANGSYGVRSPVFLHLQPSSSQLVPQIGSGARRGCPRRSNLEAGLSHLQHLVAITKRPSSGRTANPLQSGVDRGRPALFWGIAKKMWDNVWDRRRPGGAVRSVAPRGRRLPPRPQAPWPIAQFRRTLAAGWLTGS